MVWSSTKSEDEGKQNKADNDNDLDAREPEFKLSKETNSKVVDSYNGDQEDGDENSWVNLVSRHPILQDERRCSELVWGDYKKTASE